YAAAVQAFQSAVGLRPEDAGANQALVDAQQALEADQAEKKKLADFEDHLAAGKAALAAQRYADALREFLAAQRLLPADLAADQGRQEAERRLAELERENKGKADYTRLLEKGGTALQNHRFEEAVRAYQEAKKLFPRDPDVLQGLQDATKALTDARADFTRLMNQGDAAMLAERFDEAVQAYGDASRLFPNDDKAAQVLRRAQQVLDGVQGSGGMYARWMLQGATALRLRHFREAVRCFSEALRLAPGDLDAAQGLQEARAGLSDVVRVKATFDQLMQAGAAAYQQHRYGDAVQAFSQALALFPDDLTAAGSLQKASYAQHMAEGQAALGAKRYTDAAQAFQNALNDLPGDLAASNALTLARSYLKK
ncbi:MAG: tetratricopeptide repeat protein, partial [Planctomycetes bacterium]|nr:tetratricopeptide repeat protein [Planctomycetota bacterium]